MSNNSAFIEAVEKLIAGLCDMFKKMAEESKKPKKDKLEKEMLLKLAAACESYNMDGVDVVMEEIESYEYESDRELAEWLRKNVDQMNFSEIIERLSGLTS